jgi:hypothetical protein
MARRLSTGRRRLNVPTQAALRRPAPRRRVPPRRLASVRDITSGGRSLARLPLLMRKIAANVSRAGGKVVLASCRHASSTSVAARMRPRRPLAAATVIARPRRSSCTRDDHRLLTKVVVWPRRSSYGREVEQPQFRSAGEVGRPTTLVAVSWCDVEAKKKRARGVCKCGTTHAPFFRRDVTASSTQALTSTLAALCRAQ